MRRHGIAAVLAIALAGAIANVGVACTGFAVYSGEPLYGMNFDYPPNEVRFSIEEHETGLLFLGSFLFGEYYVSTVGMNEHGLFAADQMVFPSRATVDEPSDDELFIWDAFYGGVRDCKSVDEVLTWIGARRVVQYQSLQLHNLYADSSGRAAVVECGAAGNVITEIEGPSLVMTNFHNGDFRGLPPRDVAGVGAERYRVATRYIGDNLVGFDVDHGLELLRRTSISTGDFKTRYSVVFDPEALEVYIAVERDYDCIWKASLIERTIETYRGFDEYHAFPLDETGIAGETLRGYAPTVPEVPVVAQEPSGPGWLLLALIGAGLLGGVLLLLSKR